MDKKTVIEIVDRFHKELQAQGVNPCKLILHGSYATGTNREGSDIDLVVVSDDFIGMNYWKRIDILSEVIYQIFAPIEAVALTIDEWEKGDSFIVDYASNGEVLFAA